MEYPNQPEELYLKKKYILLIFALFFAWQAR